ncbi:MAG: formate--tetrahydrofolate ligase [Mycoplasmoidaceae bacterium]|nr:formate--tetrahydrofolate ligase [Mycoplasmoidaceae bacterium]
MNDRGLRNITVNVDLKKNISYKSGYDITAASELMAIFCLAKNLDDLKERINNILVAYSKTNKPIYVKDLGIVNAILKILKYAFKPNAVQSLEGNLALIHGGPFANIAHGCNSIVATNTAMNIADYTVTEAGFASELGAEKFLDIVANEINKFPNAIVLVTSIRSLKMHGDVNNPNALEVGLDNLQRHINNLKNFKIPFMVAINKFATDSANEIAQISKFLEKQKIEYSLCTNFVDGSKGTTDLAKKVVKLCAKSSKPQRIYSTSDSVKDKIKKIAAKCYGAKDVVYSPLAQTKLKQLAKYKQHYICMAKTPISFTDDPKVLTVDKPFSIHVKDLVLVNGAKFIVVLTGDIFRMPGLPKTPAAKEM